MNQGVNNLWPDFLFSFIRSPGLVDQELADKLNIYQQAWKLENN
jgi:hypothetical protein